MGALDMAVWDAVAKIAGLPLWRLLADRFNGGSADETVWVYAAGGYYYPGKDLRALQAELRSYLDRGYRVVKMKIGAVPLEEDLRRIDAALEVVQSGERLAVDANGRFDLKTALAYADALARHGLFWYEEPGDPLDFELQAELGRRYPLPMATGENLFSHQDVRNLLRYGGMRPDRDWLQFDCALSYGLVEYLRTLEVLDQMGWSRRRVVPHGGHQMSLNIAAGLGLGGNESYPDVFRPFGGFADGLTVQEGRVRLPDAPGVGFETKAELISLLRTVAE
jgi:L-alanine-DL-glutamate epimerase-like enolase superfamily enzyme